MDRTETRTVTLYSGRHQITFNEYLHCYTCLTTNAKPDGVTTILGLVPKYLLPWVARTTSEEIRENLLLLDRIDNDDIIEICERAKKAYERKRDTAGDIGTEVHQFAEDLLKGEKLVVPDGPARAGCLAVKTWCAQLAGHKFESERIIFSERLFYAGTCDLYLPELGIVVDFKTGSGFYEDQTLQLAAYAMAIEEETKQPIKEGWIIHIDKETGKCTPYPVEMTKELKDDWEQVRIAWRAIKRNQDRHRQIKRNQKTCPTFPTITARVEAPSSPLILATT